MLGTVLKFTHDTLTDLLRQTYFKNVSFSSILQNFVAVQIYERIMQMLLELLHHQSWFQDFLNVDQVLQITKTHWIFWFTRFAVIWIGSSCWCCHSCRRYC